MYKLVVADDEKIMRDGLINLIDWKTMGFEVVAQFEDGEEVLRHLKESHVDVLLTDIKMTFVSGLDLAKYIKDQNLSTKVVFISGYKDFEYARKAIRYNIIQYILKPISLSDIHDAFKEVKQKLDLEKEMKNKIKNKKDEHFELLAFMRNQFFVDLAFGALRSRKEMDKRLSYLNFEANFGLAPCCILSISLVEYFYHIDKSWEYGEEELHRAIYNFFYGNNGTVNYYFISGRQDKMRIMAIGESKFNVDVFLNKVKDDIELIKYNVFKIMKLKFTLQIDELFNNIYDLAIHRNPIKIENKENENHYIKITNEDKEHLGDQYKLLMTHIRSGNKESVYSVFEQIIEDISPLGLIKTQNFMIDFFANLINDLGKDEISIDEILKNKIIYSDIFKIGTIEEIRTWGFEILLEVIINIGKYEEKSNVTLIGRIKSYIYDNYSNDVTLETVADYVFLSPVYLSRFFKEKTGENFSDYLIKVRMEKAMEILKNPCYKVYEISNMVGYKSVKHFYRLFKQFTGLTPTEYRKKL